MSFKLAESVKHRVNRRQQAGAVFSTKQNTNLLKLKGVNARAKTDETARKPVRLYRSDQYTSCALVHDTHRKCKITLCMVAEVAHLDIDELIQPKPIASFLEFFKAWNRANFMRAK